MSKIPAAMVIVCPSTGGAEPAVESWRQTMRGEHEVRIYPETTGPEASYLSKVQRAYEQTTQDIIAYFHSDLTIHEPGWDERVLREFADPRVGIVSFSGAMRHGHPDIYKVPYDYRQLARFRFVSNLSDAEVHGERDRNEQNVAVCDSFAIIVRRELLDRTMGWPIDGWPPTQHCTDYWLCLQAHRHNYLVRYVGISCTHASGGVALGQWDYAAWAATTPYGSDAEMHRASHRLIYDEFRDVLPVEVK